MIRIIKAMMKRLNLIHFISKSNGKLFEKLVFFIKKEKL